MNNVSSLDDFTSRLMPLTYFRRNAGEVMARLPKVGFFILTKDGKPLAKLVAANRKVESDTVEKKTAKLRKIIGGLRLGKGTTPSQMNKLLDARYAEMLPR